MSVFSQLMMRIKGLFAIIHGTLTESPKGVFSGFNDSNYLMIDEVFPSSATELQVKFTAPSTIPSSGTQSVINVGLFSLRMYNKLITLYGGSGNQTVIPQADLVGGSTYIIRATINNKTCSFSYSKDGGEFVESTTWTSNIAYSTIRIGNSTNTGRGWKGSIDVANTYIKIGNKFWYKGLYK